jgi:hypothetical protein
LFGRTGQCQEQNDSREDESNIRVTKALRKRTTACEYYLFPGIEEIIENSM